MSLADGEIRRPVAADGRLVSGLGDSVTRSTSGGDIRLISWRWSEACGSIIPSLDCKRHGRLVRAVMAFASHSSPSSAFSSLSFQCSSFHLRLARLWYLFSADCNVASSVDQVEAAKDLKRLVLAHPAKDFRRWQAPRVLE